MENVHHFCRFDLNFVVTQATKQQQQQTQPQFRAAVRTGEDVKFYRQHAQPCRHIGPVDPSTLLPFSSRVGTAALQHLLGVTSDVGLCVRVQQKCRGRAEAAGKGQDRALGKEAMKQAVHRGAPTHEAF